MERRFAVGELVHHRRYKYRGVIFGCDGSFQGDESWYAGNQSQPDKKQPWYHVMVDGANFTTYVAEENLEFDLSRNPITHPLLRKVFSAFHDGRYYNHSLN